MTYNINTMTIESLKKKLKTIQSFGFVKTHREGDTGIGKTIEDMLGIEENNIPLPDIGEVAELKAYRKNTLSMLTLFTFEPRPRKGGRDRILLDTFGYPGRGERSKELYSTLSCKRYNNHGLKIDIKKSRVFVAGKGRNLNMYWETDDLKKKFDEKLPALVHVLADSKKINEAEHFHFNEAYFLKGFDFEKFKKMMQKDEVTVDLRMHYKPNGTIRNHGTAFRVKINKLDDAFETKDRLI